MKKKPTQFSYFSTFLNYSSIVGFHLSLCVYFCFVFVCFFLFCLFLFLFLCFCFFVFLGRCWVGDGSNIHRCIFKIMYQFVGLLFTSFRRSLLSHVFWWDKFFLQDLHWSWWYNILFFLIFSKLSNLLLRNL